MFKPGAIVKVKGRVEEVITTEEGVKYGIRVEGELCFRKVVVKESEVKDYDNV